VVRLWNPQTGEELAVLPVAVPQGWVEHLVWEGGTGRLAASAGKVLRVWEIAPEGIVRELAEVPGHKSTISALAWTPRGGGVVSACYGGAWLWQVGRKEPVRPFLYEGALLTIALNPTGEYLASGNLDASVHLWRTDSQQHWHMSGYPSKVRAVMFDHDGRHLYTTAGPGLVVWDSRKFEGSSGRMFNGHLGWIQEIACHPSRSMVATVGEEGMLCLWEPASTKPLAALEVNKAGGLACVAWSPDGGWIAAGADDGTVTVFRVEGPG
jgi:WD40 repeat protein